MTLPAIDLLQLSTDPVDGAGKVLLNRCAIVVRGQAVLDSVDDALCKRLERLVIGWGEFGHTLVRDASQYIRKLGNRPVQCGARVCRSDALRDRPGGGCGGVHGRANAFPSCAP